MKTTIMEVAKHAGVSIKTVSRVLNNEPNVTDKTREKVNAAAKALRYRPNLAARGLASSKSYMLALLYDNPSAEYIAQIQAGATEACRARGYHLVVEPVALENEKLTTEMETLLARLPVDGVILTPPLTESKRLITLFKSYNKPFVQIAPAAPTPSIPSVSMDDKAASKEIVDYLISIGHRDIAIILGHPRHPASADRYAGYQAALREAGIAENPNFVRKGDFSFASGRRAAAELLDLPRRPSAIFASNDDMAAACMSVAGERGLSTPKDISICGFDDTTLAEVLWPPLTTVRQPIHQMGLRAAQLLIERDTDGQDMNLPQQLDHEVVIRGSTAPQR